MTKKFFNPNAHRVFINDKDGNEVSVAPIELMNTNHAPQGAVYFVEGEHFAQYASFGQLAVFKETNTEKKEAPAPIVKPVPSTDENTTDQQSVDPEDVTDVSKHEDKPEATTSASIASTVRTKKGRK